MERVFRGRDVCPRQKGGLKVGQTKRGKGTKLMVLVDGQGTPLGLHVDSASPAEVKLLEATLDTVKGGTPERLIADRGYESNPARAMLAGRDIDPIIPKRQNNGRATRKLRRYSRRWIIERTNAWLQNYRRLVVRWERSAEVYTALVHAAFAMICLRRVLG
jgi:transposase